MKSSLIELTLLVLLCLTVASVDDAQWKSELLQNVSDISKLGYPGQSIVFGNNASVIVLGDTDSDILIAASQLGSGRIVVITHSSYVTNFNTVNSVANIQTLQTNIKKWVTRGTFTSNADLITAQSFVKYTGTNQYKILWTTQNRAVFTEAQKDKVLNFVKNGGALVVGATPWGWAQIKGSSDFNLMLTYKTLLQAGIALTQSIIWGSSTFKVINPLTSLSHVGVQVGNALLPQSTAIDYSKTRNVAKRIRSLPDSAKQTVKQQTYNGISLANLQLTPPTSATPVTSNYIKARLMFYQYAVLERNQQGVTAPGFNAFPGAILDDISSSLTSDSFTFVPNPLFTQYYQTGYYAPAGQVVNIQITGALPKKSWKVRLGFHYDDNSNHDKWIRWPTVYTQVTLTSANTTIASPYGGLVVFQCPSGSNQTLQVKISNVIQSPHYDSQNPASVSEWATRKNAPGLWGCAQGKWIAFCIPSASLKTVDDPSVILNIYDQMHEVYHTLRGTLPQKQRKRFIIGDIKPSAGYMHSGYPIVTSMDVTSHLNSNFVFNLSYLKTNGHWGIFHENGHNMQRGWWTFSGTGQVTVNIFSLRATELIVGTSPKNASWLNNQKSSIAKYLLNPNFTTWSNSPGIALGIYAQVIQDYGWATMQRVMTWYESAPSSALPVTDQDQIDIFWARYSIESGVDLTLLLKKWAIPFTAKFSDQVAGLPAYVQIVKIF